jgi:6-phospho-3-hexuloisomerase
MTPAASAPQRILAELDSVFARSELGRLDELAQRVDGARRLVCAGQGRSGLVAAALAVRLVHLGFEAHVAGAATQPAIGGGDLIIGISRTGRTAITLHQAQRALAAGASIAAITGRDDGPLPALADVVVVLPVAAVDSSQHAGSLFEQAALIAADSLTAALQRARGLTDADLAARHDNLQ